MHFRIIVTCRNVHLYSERTVQNFRIHNSINVSKTFYRQINAYESLFKIQNKSSQQMNV